MAEPITAKQLGILQFIAKNPDRSRTILIATAGATEEDLLYLAQHDMIRERGIDTLHISHFGEMVLKRSL